ncbi:lipoyl(octanoyl) transferase LipB [Corynebacterium sp. ES2715-CONJ3]|uniref:lipoyl(octanoyl) transferase LipB n=1 Tax=Corynebacterium sp. ES2715-CONJ3 TaxID=2974028 RepID=UPI0021693A63|nr:lipoyl(octanoyl) transferase LipB [Corynebacterium sp. ES2715-CONJ3]MCS4492416.1 lipoyl(octanoyl) transferase LipB [Corynebacterium sp. ES2715-CONJ3]
MTAPRKPFFPPHLSIRHSDAPIAIQRLGVVDYLTAWEMQAELAQQRAAEEIPDTILVLEHPSIYTAGKRTQPEDRPHNGLPVINVDRGGRITWHGPGQLVAYPIIKLADPIDVVDYVRRVEEALIKVVRNKGLEGAGRVDGRSGVWIPGDHHFHRKIAALGIRITRGVTMHGLALNCCNTLKYYDHIIPCGIADAGVTTLSVELGREITVEEMIEPTLTALEHAFAGSLAVSDHSFDVASDPTKTPRAQG